MPRASPYRTILITGASRGLGAALAFAHAAPGVTLALTARDQDRLEAVAERCRQSGAEVIAARIDITDTETVRQWVTELDRDHPLDLVIANAGIASTIVPGGPAEDWQRLRQVFDTNLYGALATVEPAVAAMARRGRGQIALMSSLGGYVGMPISPAYNASKAALKIYGEGLRGVLAGRGVGVTVICPGFVATAMSEVYPGPRPFLVPVERAAAIIRAGLARNRARIAFPWPLALAMWLLSLLPTPANLFLQRLFRFA